MRVQSVSSAPQARRLDLHQRDQAVHLGLVRHQLGQDAPEPEGILAQCGTHPVLASGRRVAFVEHEVDDLEDHYKRAVSSASLGASKGTCASPRVRFARTIRC